MMRIAAILVFALGASAQVPHWVQKKPSSSFKMPSVASKITPLLSKYGRQTPNSRRLDDHGEGMPAIMSEACKEDCPGSVDLLLAMMGGGERRLDDHGEEGGDKEGEMEMMMKMCDYMDAVKCVAKTETCQDEEPTEKDAQEMAMMECMCACPKMAKIGDDGAGICADKAGTIGCVTSTSSCSSMAETMNEKEINLGCEYQSKGCEESMQNILTCAGEEVMTTWSTTCDDKVADDATTCCPILSKLVECVGSDCLAITMAMDKLRAESGSEGAATSQVQ